MTWQLQSYLLPRVHLTAESASLSYVLHAFYLDFGCSLLWRRRCAAGGRVGVQIVCFGLQVGWAGGMWRWVVGLAGMHNGAPNNIAVPLSSALRHKERAS